MSPDGVDEIGQRVLIDLPEGESQKPLLMVFDPNVIDHLGIRLYSQLPAALNELVTNAYDADSKTVIVTCPVGAITDSAVIEIKDNGVGMSREDVRTQYLNVGRDRRVDGFPTSPSGRIATGRKGLGKLAAFGVAETIELRTKKDGIVTSIRLTYENMKVAKGDYQPETLNDDGSLDDRESGTKITLLGLKRKSDIDINQLVIGLSKRLAMIDDNFIVEVNNVNVEPSSKHDKDDCEDGMFWAIEDLPEKYSPKQEWNLLGWFGFVVTSKQTERGVNIYANKKAAEVGSFFNYPGTSSQFARAYLVGEIHGDFLDQSTDLIATARNGIVWEDPIASEFELWGQNALRWLFSEWSNKRRAKRHDEIFHGAGFEDWLTTRSSLEQKIANKTIALLIDDPKMDEERARPLVEIVKASIESRAFDELVLEFDSLADDPPVALLLRLFNDWNIIESREFLRIFKGRLEGIERLQRAIEGDSAEVALMQPLLFENLWILDPGWKRADREMHYSTLARDYANKKHPADESNKRMDIFAVSASGRMSVIEVKRSSKVLSQEDINQIADYRQYIRNLSKTTSDFSSYDVDALLVVGQMNPSLADMVRDNQNVGIKIATWADLCRRARAIYEEYNTALEVAAPEYAKTFKAEEAQKSEIWYDAKQRSIAEQKKVVNTEATELKPADDRA